MENQIKKIITHLEALRKDLLKDAEMPDATERGKLRSEATAYGIKISVEEIKNFLIPPDEKSGVPKMQNPPPPPEKSAEITLPGRWIKEMSKILSDQNKNTKYHHPYKCPVCNGNGIVPNGFYHQTTGEWSTSSIEPETCQSCKGSGIVWG